MSIERRRQPEAPQIVASAETLLDGVAAPQEALAGHQRKPRRMRRVSLADLRSRLAQRPTTGRPIIDGAGDDTYDDVLKTPARGPAINFNPTEDDSRLHY